MSFVRAVLASPDARAQTTISSCGGSGAPTLYRSASCAIICTLNVGGTTMSCAGASLCPDMVQATAVFDFDGVGVITAWGLCTVSAVETPWCCRLDDGNETVAKVELKGSGNGDLLSFTDTDSSGEVNLEDHRDALLKGVMYAGDGGDDLVGSNFHATDFREFLFAEGGDDDTDCNGGVDYSESGTGATSPPAGTSPT